MSKRFTSLLVGALAVVLLGAPVQAQTDARRAPVNNGNRILTHKVVKPGQYAEQHKAALANQQKESEVQQATVQAASLQTAATQQDRNVNALPAVATVSDMRFGTFERPLPFRAPLRQVSETVDANGIILAPAEGEHKYYNRSGFSYRYNSQLQSSPLREQSGHVELVECADGTVYVKDLICAYANGVWLKGKKEGNTITFNVGQPIVYNATYDATVSIYWGDATVSNEACTDAVKDGSIETIVFQIDGDVVSLQGSSETKVLSLFWDDDNSWNGNCDFGSVWTYDADFVPASTELVEAPADLETEDWKFSYSHYSTSTAGSGKLTVGISGNDFYMKGFFGQFPEAWIKGNIEGNTVTFPKMQFLGVYGSYNAWAVASTTGDELEDIVFSYDAENNVITQVSEYIFITVSSESISYLDYIYGAVVKKAAEILPVEVPYENTLDTEDAQDQIIIYDENGDGKTWTFTEDGYAQYSYNSSEAADDWLVTPAMYLEEGKKYRFAFDAACALSDFPERVEVLIGTEAKVSAFETVVIEPTDVDWTAFETVQNESVTVSETGYYFFGIHAISDADMYRLYVDNILVEEGVLPTSPAAPFISSVVPDPYGLNKATITVVAPSTNIAGEPLTENIAAIAILRNGQEVKRFENVRPEDTKVFVDFVDQAGQNKYQAVPYTAEGKRGAKSEVAEVYVGLDIPSLVDNVVANELEDGSVDISWDPVTTGLNDGVVVADDITYLVCGVETEYMEFMGYLFPYYTLYPVMETSGLSANIDLDYDGEQTVEQIAIVAINDAVDDVEDYLAEIADYAPQASFFAGAPTEMPIEEHFGDASSLAWYFDASEAIEAYYSNENSDEEGYAISLLGDYGAGTAYIQFGKVAINGSVNPIIAIDAKSTNAANKMRVEVQTPDGKSTLVKVIKIGEEYKTYKISLADFANNDFVKVKVSFDIANESEVLLDNVMIIDQLEYNLTTAISAPESVKAGESAPVTVTVKNMGEKAAENFTVKVFANDDQLLSEKVTEPLASFGKQEFTVDFPTTIFDEAGDVTLSAEVIYTLDLDDNDNAAETVITVKQSTVAAPENVVAENTGEGVKLSWAAPTLTATEVTEDFENGLTEGWTVLDNDEDGYSWSLLDMTEFEKKPHSGNFAIRSDSYINDVGALTPDNWIVTPLASLTGTFSFWAWGYDANYAAEHFQVFVSTDNGETFEAVSDEFIATEEQTEYSVDLSSYNGVEGYIAIRHYNVTDEFCILVDDITYIQSAGSIVGYNIYVDGELYETTTETTFEIAGASSSSTFAVSSVYSNGKESRPVVVTVGAANQEITAIEQIATNGQAVDIYSLDGRMVRRQATSLEGLRGAYIINGRKVMVK